MATARLDDFGDVLSCADLAQLLGVGERYFEKLVTLENKTGVRCLPESIPGLGFRRFTKEAVRRWLKVGIPQRGRWRGRR